VLSGVDWMRMATRRPREQVIPPSRHWRALSAVAEVRWKMEVGRAGVRTVSLRRALSTACRPEQRPSFDAARSGLDGDGDVEAGRAGDFTVSQLASSPGGRECFTEDGS